MLPDLVYAADDFLQVSCADNVVGDYGSRNCEAETHRRENTGILLLRLHAIHTLYCDVFQLENQ